jgi:flagellar protein FlbT
MVLRIELKPGERLFIGTSVLKNGGNRTHLGVEGNLPILRDRDVIEESSCDTPVKRLYACIQQSYLSGSDPEAQPAYALNIVGACQNGELSVDLAEELGPLASKDGFRALRLLRPFLPPEAFPTIDRSDAPKLNDRKRM